MGGAQRVHIDILESISALPKQVFFTRKSPDKGMKNAFESVQNCSLLDIHFWCDNLLFRLFAVHYWAFFLNRHRSLKILSSNSTFFYDLLPWLRRDFQRIELLHNFTYGKKGMEFFGLANHVFLDQRIVVDFFTAENVRRQYAEAGVAEEFMERIRVVEPGVFLPERLPQKDFPPLKVLYAGRGGAQKRVWLIDRIAASCFEQKLPVQFHFAGNVEDELSFSVKELSIMHGSISNPLEMKKLYSESHVILLTSAYEGFPMFIKEGMAQGCIPVVTALPGNKTHLRHEENALLIEAIEDEDAVVNQGIALIEMLCAHQEEIARLSQAAFDYAQGHFSAKAFRQSYRQLLE